MKKIRTYLLFFISLGFLMFTNNSVLAHPGRTDSSGCHTCRTNCSSWGLSTGEYHCHRAKALPQPIEPIKSIRNESGTGTTVPAPEYKIPKMDEKKDNIDQVNSKSTENIKTPIANKKISLWQRFLSFLGW